jgi:hypothetical protein
MKTPTPSGITAVLAVIDAYEDALTLHIYDEANGDVVPWPTKNSWKQLVPLSPTSSRRPIFCIPSNPTEIHRAIATPGLRRRVNPLKVKASTATRS